MVTYKGKKMTAKEALEKIQPKKLTEDQIREIAKDYNLEYACIKAVIEVESAGSGFQSDGRPKILFEGHRFYYWLKQLGIDPTELIPGNENIIYPKWVKTYYKEDQWKRFDKAKKISVEAAIMSCSWGMFQIMGENVKNGLLRRYSNLNSFFVAQHLSEKEHMLDFIDFVNNKKLKGLPLITYLRAKDWANFSYSYNGGGYKQNQYDTKLERAYNSYKQ